MQQSRRFKGGQLNRGKGNHRSAIPAQVEDDYEYGYPEQEPYDDPESSYDHSGPNTAEYYDYDNDEGFSYQAWDESGEYTDCSDLEEWDAVALNIIEEHKPYDEGWHDDDWAYIVQSSVPGRISLNRAKGKGKGKRRGKRKRQRRQER